MGQRARYHLRHDLFPLRPRQADRRGGPLRRLERGDRSRPLPIGGLDHGRFFLGIDENSEICLVETWPAAFGPAQDAPEKLILGIAPQHIDTAG
ncbi:hypothetical protein ACFW2X_31630 [Streptomyces antibioticus]|uniref:hypothetical protein n=1 Tax=Streptomyces antibioticus TaxID=1890 RepID=UPI00369DDA3D